MKKPRNRNDNSYNTKIQGQLIDTSNLQVSMKEVDSNLKNKNLRKRINLKRLIIFEIIYNKIKII